MGRASTKNGSAIMKFAEESSIPNWKEAGQWLDLNIGGWVVWWKISGRWGFRDSEWSSWIDSSVVLGPPPPILIDIVMFDHIHFPVSKVKQLSPVTGTEWPRGFQEVKVPRFHDNGT